MSVKKILEELATNAKSQIEFEQAPEAFLSARGLTAEEIELISGGQNPEAAHPSTSTSWNNTVNDVYTNTVNDVYNNTDNRVFEAN